MENILLIEDHPMVMGGLVDICTSVFPSATLHKVSSLDGLQKKASQGSFGLAISDLLLPGCTPDQLLRYLQAALHVDQLVFYSGLPKGHASAQAVRKAGYDYVEKSEPVAEFVKILQRFATASTPISVSRHTAYTSQVQLPGRRPLTLKQVEILDLLMEGKTIAQAAEVLDLSPHTVKAYVKEAYARLGVNNRASAIEVFMQAKRIGRYTAQA